MQHVTRRIRMSYYLKHTAAAARFAAHGCSGLWTFLFAVPYRHCLLQHLALLAWPAGSTNEVQQAYGTNCADAASRWVPVVCLDSACACPDNHTCGYQPTATSIMAASTHQHHKSSPAARYWYSTTNRAPNSSMQCSHRPQGSHQKHHDDMQCSHCCQFFIMIIALHQSMPPSILSLASRCPL